MTTYEPGTVAIVTWDNASLASKGQGVSDVRSDRAIRTADGHWSLTSGWNFAITDSSPTDVRPLVVLDVADAPHGPKEHYVRWLHSVADDEQAARPGHGNGRPAFLRWIADQIEVQTKPPHIPEPGLWGVVKARVGKSGTEWHATKFPDDLWHVDDGGSFYWHEFIDPVLVRDGIEDGAS